jgi:predicted O-methyltransferase YrrM
MKKPKRTRPRKTSQRRNSASRRPDRKPADALWIKVDDYLCGHLLPDDAVLDSALETSAAAGLPPIAVAPNQGKLLQMLAQMIGARSILEIGTLGGYSTIWMARALPDGGRIVTLEVDPKHADVARRNFARARLDGAIELRLGNALDTLPLLAADRSAPFDLVFIDADKENIPAYFDWAVKLSHPGSLIIVDNVVRDGEVANARTTDPRVIGVREFFEQLGDDPRVTATALQSVGIKGYDGLAFALVR